jgi:hypothetical protein
VPPQVNTNSPLKRVNVEKSLYELKQFEFMLSNPFPADCEFEVTLSHTKADDDTLCDKRDKPVLVPSAAKPGARRSTTSSPPLVRFNAIAYH